MTIKILQRPIFILGAHKSGSSLFRQLLDGHPELFAVPMETHIFQRAGYWVDYPLRRTRPPTLSLEKAKEEYVAQVKQYHTVRDPLGDAVVAGRFNIQQLQKELEFEVASFPELVTAYLRGIYRALMDAPLPENLRVVEKSVEHAEFAVELKSMFPDAKFLHILRNPYANLVSLRLTACQRHTRGRYPSLVRQLAALENSFYYLYRNRRLLKDDYMVIRYEDLLTAPRPTMQAITNFLEIEFQESLLQPTLLGELWSGNSSRAVKFSEISASQLDKWLGQITALEIHYINEYFKFLLEDYDYGIEMSNRSQFWPVRGETLGIYIANRLISYYL